METGRVQAVLFPIERLAVAVNEVVTQLQVTGVHSPTCVCVESRQMRPRDEERMRGRTLATRQICELVRLDPQHAELIECFTRAAPDLAAP